MRAGRCLCCFGVCGEFVAEIEESGTYAGFESCPFGSCEGQYGIWIIGPAYEDCVAMSVSGNVDSRDLGFYLLQDR